MNNYTKLEMFNMFKKHMIEYATNIMKKDGKLSLFITILSLKKDSDNPDIMLAPFLGGDKDDFVDNLVSFLKDLKVHDNTILGLAVLYESWIRKTDHSPESEELIKSGKWKDLPKTEAVCFSFECFDKNENTTLIYDIIKGEAMVATPEGDLINDISLELNKEISGSDGISEGRLANILSRI